jgi:hypothetical protein
MSTQLYWKPVRPEREESLCNQLKYIFARTYWDHDGSLCGEEIVLRPDSLAYLSGIRDGSNDKELKQDIEILIKAIQKYGSIAIWLET